MKDESRQSLTARRLCRSFILHPFALILFFLFLAPPAFAGQININTAQEEELTSLPYIGTARAQAIISHRTQHGPFRHIEDLLEVESIGPKSVEAIGSYISLANQRNGAPAAEPHIFASGEIMLLADDHYFPVLINFVKTARQRIDMAMFLFKTTESKNNKPAQLVEELIKASKRGVLVQVILEKSGYNDSLNLENERVAAKLLKHNIKVRFDSPKKTTHTKTIIIDRRFCFVGSHNLSHSALAFNHELSLLLDNPKMAATLTDYLATIK